MRDRDDALDDAFRATGGALRLARALGITAQAVSQWQRVPPLRVLQVERVSSISRYRLRPDLYPEPFRDNGADSQGIAQNDL